MAMGATPLRGTKEERAKGLPTPCKMVASDLRTLHIEFMLGAAYNKNVAAPLPYNPLLNNSSGPSKGIGVLLYR